MTRTQSAIDFVLRWLAAHLYCRRYGHSAGETFVRNPDTKRGGYVRYAQCVRCRDRSSLKWQPMIPVRMLAPPERTRA